MAILQPYQAVWAEEFEQIKQVYLEALGDMALAVEHVGSTAVPGLAAKPVLDIDVVIASYEVFHQVVLAFERLGYSHNGDQGIPEREAFARSSKEVPLRQPSRLWMNHHLYVCPADSRELRRHLLFREALRRSPAIREEYQKLKMSLVARSEGDRKVYAHLKQAECSDFIEGVMAENKMQVADS